MKSSEERLGEIIEAQRRADEERASRHVLQTIQRALREAFLALPEEDYDWFDIRREGRGSGKRFGTRPVPGGYGFPFWNETRIERRPVMCCGKTKCERPNELKGMAEKCSPEQIRKCHGNVKEHPCMTRNKSR
jgi:hypothetical protein